MNFIIYCKEKDSQEENHYGNPVVSDEQANLQADLLALLNIIVLNSYVRIHNTLNEINNVSNEINNACDEIVSVHNTLNEISNMNVLINKEHFIESQNEEEINKE